MKHFIENETPIDQIPFLALDTETCGLYESRVVELAGVRFYGGVEQDRFQTLVDPEEWIPSEVTAIHGITNEMVAGAPTIREVLIEFLEFSAGTVWLAHNAPFDVKILAAEFYRSELPIPERYVLDSCRLSRRFNDGLQSHSLGHVCRHFDVRQEDAHRALGDSIDVMNIFMRMMEKHPEMTYRELLKRHGKPYDFDKAIKTSHLIPERAVLDRTA